MTSQNNDTDNSIIEWNDSNLNNDFFPLIVFDNGMFNTDLYDKLKNSFPKISDFKTTNNSQSYRTNIELRKEGTREHKHNVSVLRKKYPEYYKMFEYFTGDDFKKQIFKRFDTNILQKNGFKGNIKQSDVLVQICQSTGGYENPFHIDSRKRIVHGLLYFGKDNIVSGGELCIGKHRPLNKLIEYPQYPDLKNLEEIKAFPPNDNFGVFVLSTPNSYHKGNSTKGVRNFLYISIDYTGGNKVAWECGWTKKSKPFTQGLKLQKHDAKTYEKLQQKIVNIHCNIQKKK